MLILYRFLINLICFFAPLILWIRIFKQKEDYNITLLFKDNAIINLSTEIIELTLEDQKNKND